MSPSKLLKGKVNINDMLTHYDRLFNKTKGVEKVKEQTKTDSHDNTQQQKQDSIEMLPESREDTSLIALNNKDNPQISIFDAYAFNEVMRRYENSIVQITKQEILLKEQDKVKDEYEQKIDSIKNQYEEKISEFSDIKEKENNMREILDQVNVLMDEKDEKILQYETNLHKRNSELSKIKKELNDKEDALVKMERQLYSVLFKITESNTLV